MEDSSEVYVMSQWKFKFVVFLWCPFQVILFLLYMNFFGKYTVCVLLTFVVWQILTEVGYYFAFKLGYHSTPEGKRVSDGRGGRMQFPDFVKNDQEYLIRRRNLTRKEKRIRFIFSMTCAAILSIFFIGSLVLFTTLSSANNFLSLIIFVLILWAALGIWNGYQVLFRRVFNLEIAWKENNRPVFKYKK
ncbi:hypothetical protein ACQUMI_001862 [Enterococcus faecalis]|uniref:hypothetical protein n=1 Tax=Enterococcus faecalis TaxID=1351 RepID=UPI001A0DC8BF|nr:hypothetical protein [Enterococcus faecalis]EGO2596445.1 hypothetical protein [Enterococcus faecalis]EGO2806992.1 hypothetical protein [Enterococcus faecalis]EGO5169174.1 hypothetical protein [Enterococcus faecalis]EGO9052192.1 hypothetical protein [Enterococcus faecalis]EGO9793929.1 hypothetical protein [Enterococcus faecalis]